MISDGRKYLEGLQVYNVIAMIQMKDLEVLSLDKSSSKGKKRLGGENMGRGSGEDLVSGCVSRIKEKNGAKSRALASYPSSTVSYIDSDKSLYLSGLEIEHL